MLLYSCCLALWYVYACILFSMSFPKNCGQIEGLGTAMCLKTVVDGKQSTPTSAYSFLYQLDFMQIIGLS